MTQALTAPGRYTLDSDRDAYLETKKSGEKE